MNSKDVGNLGEHIAIVELLKYGIIVSRPLGDNARYDLILDIKNQLFTCQVKSTASSTDALAEFSLQSSQAHRGAGKQGYDVDIFCLVDVSKQFVFLYPNLENKTAIKIRYKETSNNQTKNVNMYHDFTVQKFLDTYARP